MSPSLQRQAFRRNIVFAEAGNSAIARKEWTEHRKIDAWPIRDNGEVANRRPEIRGRTTQLFQAGMEYRSSVARLPRQGPDSEIRINSEEKTP